jgi:EAL domain-containing protein (putative c-di-GMP-specific phosphodiesterase class I)/GGDEF domain-containing protein
MQENPRFRCLGRIRDMLSGLRHADLLLLLPMGTLVAFWLGGERALLIATPGLPLLFAAAAVLRARRDVVSGGGATDAGTVRQRLTGLLDAGLRDAGLKGKTTACVVLRMDDALRFRDLHGAATEAEVLARCAERLCGALREGDVMVRLPEAGFAVGLRAGRRIDLETMVQLSARLQAAISAGIAVNAVTHYASFSTGFCLGSRAPFSTGESLLTAADMASHDAMANGPGAIRAYTPDLALRQGDRMDLRDALDGALEDGQIRPHFQPQISTDTGCISGFEALARWHHPDRGILSPADFLPMIEAAGLSERLAEVMLFQSMTALNAWDRAGLAIPSVGVNFSTSDLSNPRLTEKLKWELDRFGLEPARLSVEILETVVADTKNDILVRNIAALADMGCGIDLDDFGTGHASIGSIRRFAVRRIKIDRSFVTHVDQDRDQQKMISALVSLADRLGLDTLAEGVETRAEHAMLAQLGCRHVQGYGLARPMPVEETLAWIQTHEATRVSAPRIGKRAVGP